MIYVIELSTDGGQSWQAYQPAGLYRHPQGCEERARGLQLLHERLLPSSPDHGYLYRAQLYGPKEDS